MHNRKSKLFITGLSLCTAALHFITGPQYKGPFPDFVNGYLIDLVLPMSFYLLLQVGGRDHFSVRATRIGAAVFTFGFGILVELLQYYQVDFLGHTFDPLDILMYGTGVCAGIGIDLTLIDRWENKRREK